MSIRLTNEQAQAQRERFETFMQSANLVKIGERIIWFTVNDAEDGRFTPHVYIHRILNSLAKVNGSMYHPEQVNNTWGMYSDLLNQYAVRAYVDTLPKK